jgi:hypothetical protein
MEERVLGAGGRLTLSNLRDGGFALIATLPVARTEAPAERPARSGVFS